MAYKDEADRRWPAASTIATMLASRRRHTRRGTQSNACPSAELLSYTATEIAAARVMVQILKYKYFAPALVAPPVPQIVQIAEQLAAYNIGVATFASIDVRCCTCTHAWQDARYCVPIMFATVLTVEHTLLHSPTHSL